VRRLGPLVRAIVPLGLLAVAILPTVSTAVRIAGAAGLIAFWTLVYVRYRRAGLMRTQREWEQLRSVRWDVFWRHYNERVPTIEEEFELWGPYHQHRHEMRYDLVAEQVRRNLPDGGRVLDVGAGSALVADRIADRRAFYIGIDFGEPHVAYAVKKFSTFSRPLHVLFGRGDAALLPFASGSFDVVVMSEVIEHLIRPELAVWEIARVLKPDGVFVMTTNNASEVPLRSPLSHLFAWIEKALGATFPSLISYRPWVWPEKVDPDLLPLGSGDVYLPHTHHISAQTRGMFAAAGLLTAKWFTFEFPPPHSASAKRLERMGAAGRRVVDIVETVARSVPGLRRLGTHLFVLSTKSGDAVATRPPASLWPGPFSRPDTDGEYK
jgi:SAM-dependent methyltransferase